MLQGPAERWGEEFAAQTGQDEWANQFAAGFADGIDTNEWMEEYAQDSEARQAAAEAGAHLALDLLESRPKPKL